MNAIAFQAWAASEADSLPTACARASCHVVDDLDPGLREDMRALGADASEPNSYQEGWFFGAAWDHLPRAGVRLLVVRDGGGALIGTIALVISPTLARLPIHHVQNWRHDQDFLGLPLVRKGRERDYWGALLDHLDEASWAKGLLHVRGLVEDGPVHRGLVAAAAERGRSCPLVHREIRAMLSSTLSPQAYYERAVRKKKRKEIGRLTNRLSELGSLAFRTLAPGEDVAPWCDQFLMLERSGWKGRGGSALACRDEGERFLRQALSGAQAEGRLQIRSLDLEGRPIAMLINLLAPPGSFSFKTAYDEEYARFSPGVLLQIENLDNLSRKDIDWMDSCAIQNHPMIDGLWTERRSIVRVSVRLAGLRRGLAYGACRGVETAWTFAKPVTGGAK